ncbi:thiol reductant ABC exporter subunit CydC [Alkalilimnicola ehrlichii]|uniref:thiol reductant ABC exporter subunit CydC n=1 Tax=Alkalilimnicola ehrlichii TaxID=351052 RepID=UPI003B9FCB75
MSAQRPLTHFTRLFLRRWPWLLGGTLLTLATLLANLGLLSLSGWFITATALAGLGLIVGLDIYVPGGGIRFFAVSRTVSRYGERLVTHEATFRLLADIRCWLFARLARQDPLTLGRLRGGDLLNRLTADIEALDNLYIRVLGPTAAAGLAGLATLGLLGWVDGRLALVALALLLAGALLTWTATRRGRRSGERMSHLQPRFRAVIIEGVRGLAELRVYGGGERQRRLIGRHGRAWSQLQRRMAHLTGLGNALNGLFGQLALLAALVLGLWLHQQGLITGPQWVLALFAFMALTEALAPLPLAFQFLGRTRSAAERLLAQAEHPARVVSPATPAAMPARFDLTLKAVRYGYHAGRPVLADFSLRIPQGSHLAITGPSGLGKTTLLKLLARLDDPWSGQILVGDTPLHTLPLEAWHRRVGMLEQHAPVFSDTVAGNLRVAAPQADEARLWQALAVAGLDTRVRAMPEGLETWLGESGATLSGGEARRLALARVVLHDPDIVLLDEPAAGLDGASARALAGRLHEWLQGRTAVIVSHDPGWLPPVDRVLDWSRPGGVTNL